MNVNDFLLLYLKIPEIITNFYFANYGSFSKNKERYLKIIFEKGEILGQLKTIFQLRKRIRK